MARAGTLERVAPRPPAAPAPARPRFTLRHPSLAALFGLCLALAAFAIGLRPLADNSFFWHLQTGHWILGHGIPRGDIFSFSAPGADWVVQSWLAEALYAVVDGLMGPFGLRLLRAATSGAVVYLAFRLAVRLTGSRARAAGLTVAALIAPLTMWAERPLLLGVLAMTVLLWIVEVPECVLGRRAMVSVPVVMWVWANVHGSFALGFVYLGLHLAGRWLDGGRPWRGPDRALLLATGIAAVACLANPLGLSLLTFPVHLLSRGEVLEHVQEWKSPDVRTFTGAMFGMWALVFVAALVRGRRCSRRGSGAPGSCFRGSGAPGSCFRDLLVSGVFLLLALWAVRNVAVAPLVGLAVAARAMATTGAPDRRAAFNSVVFALLLVVGATAVVQAAAEPDYDFAAYPTQALDFVEDEGLLGRRLLTTDLWGGYVIHAYWPRQQVFIDDRYDMYPTGLAEDYLVLDAGGEGWERVLDRHGIDVVVWRTRKPLARLLDGGGGWRRLYRDDLASVWIRA